MSGTESGTDSESMFERIRLADDERVISMIEASAAFFVVTTRRVFRLVDGQLIEMSFMQRKAEP